MAYGWVLVKSVYLSVPTSDPAVANFDALRLRLATWRAAESIGRDFRWAGSKNHQKYLKLAEMTFSGQKTQLYPLCAEIEKVPFFYWLISISRPRAFIWRVALFRKTTEQVRFYQICEKHVLKILFSKFFFEFSKFFFLANSTSRETPPHQIWGNFEKNLENYSRSKFGLWNPENRISTGRQLCRGFSDGKNAYQAILFD